MQYYIVTFDLSSIYFDLQFSVAEGSAKLITIFFKPFSIFQIPNFQVKIWVEFSNSSP